MGLTVYLCNHCPFHESHGRKKRRIEHTWKQCRGMKVRLAPRAEVPTTGSQTFFPGGPTFSIAAGSGPKTGAEQSEGTEAHLLPLMKQDLPLTQIVHSYNIDLAVLGGLNRESADKLPNLRHQDTRLIPQRHHTSWKLFAKRKMNVMPSLEKVLVAVIKTKAGSGMLKDAKVFGDAGEVDVATLSEEWWENWATKVMKDRKMSTKVLDLLLGTAFPKETNEFSAALDDYIRRHWPDLEPPKFQKLPSQAFVTPRGTSTAVHYDDEVSISTVFGSDESTSDSPLKLWIVWPSTELRHMATCHGDTNKAMEIMDHGSYFLQMPGETVKVPPNSPHAVYTLETCYLHGHVLQSKTQAYDPPSLLADLLIAVERKALEKRVHRLNLGLCSPQWRRAHFEQFIETWPVEGPIFHQPDHKMQYSQLIQTWAKDIERNQSCAWCEASNVDPTHYLNMDYTEHAESHLEVRDPESPENPEPVDAPPSKQSSKAKTAAKPDKTSKKRKTNAGAVSDVVSRKRHRSQPPAKTEMGTRSRRVDR